MTNEYLDSFNGLGKSAIEATRELVEINGRLMGKILENQIKLANIFVESGEKQISSVSQSKDPKAFVATQTAFLEEYAETLAEAAQANAALAQQASAEMKSWFEKSIKNTTEEVPVKMAADKPAAKKTATPKAAKAKTPAKTAATASRKPTAKKAPTKS